MKLKVKVAWNENTSIDERESALQVLGLSNVGMIELLKRQRMNSLIPLAAENKWTGKTLMEFSISDVARLNAYQADGEVPLSSILWRDLEPSAKKRRQKRRGSRRNQVGGAGEEGVAY